MKSCAKLHPKCCTDACRFLYEGAYKHREKTIQIDEYNMLEKVKQMEKVTQALTQKVLNLKKEIIEIEKNNQINQGDERLRAGLQKILNLRRI